MMHEAASPPISPAAIPLAMDFSIGLIRFQMFSLVSQAPRGLPAIRGPVIRMCSLP